MATPSKSPLRPISPAETEILRLIWELGQASVQQVYEALPPHRDIAQGTVQTLIRRLEQKGYVKHHCQGRTYIFRAAAKPEAVIKRSVSDFLNRLFGGDPVPLMQHLAAHGHLRAEDLERLRKLVDKQ